MALSSETVRRELESFSVKFEPCLHGFELHGDFERKGPAGIAPLGAPVVWRFVHAGGVSGENQRVWWLEKKSGKDKTESVSSVAGVRRLIREWYVGEQRPGPDYVAKSVTNRFGQHYVWVKKPSRKGSMAKKAKKDDDCKACATRKRRGFDGLCPTHAGERASAEMKAEREAKARKDADDVLAGMRDRLGLPPSGSEMLCHEHARERAEAPLEAKTDELMAQFHAIECEGCKKKIGYVEGDDAPAAWCSRGCVRQSAKDQLAADRESEERRRG